MWFVIGALISVFAAASGQVEQDSVRFFLASPLLPVDTEIRTGQLSNIVIDPAREVKILAHGWLEIVSTFWYQDARNEYLRLGTSNVISLDWATHANQLYPIARTRIYDVAYFLALLVLDLHDTWNIPLVNFHIIGHSLGAHLGGFVGQHLNSLRPGARLGRITGLDPAGADFEWASINQRLSPDDAEFVDVMHTDAGVYGIMASIGDIDYFPNGGTAIQNGCIIAFCSHNRAPVYFIESIWRDGFVSTLCTNWVLYNLGLCNNNARTIMGERVNRNARGNYLLNTRFTPPFGIGS